MSALPPLPLRVLADLGGTYPALCPTTSTTASSVQRALAELLSLLKAQAKTFIVRDRIEAAFLRHRRFVRSHKLTALEAQEDALTARIEKAATHLLLAPVEGPADLTVKIGVLVARRA